MNRHRCNNTFATVPFLYSIGAIAIVTSARVYGCSARSTFAAIPEFYSIGTIPIIAITRIYGWCACYTFAICAVPYL